MHRRRRLDPMFHFYTFMSSITSFKYFSLIGFVLNVKHIYTFGNAISWNYLFTNLFVSLLHVFDTLWFMYLFDWALLSLYFIFYLIYFYHFILFHFLVFSISKRVLQTWWFFFLSKVQVIVLVLIYSERFTSLPPITRNVRLARVAWEAERKTGGACGVWTDEWLCLRTVSPRSAALELSIWLSWAPGKGLR